MSEHQGEQVRCSLGCSGGTKRSEYNTKVLGNAPRTVIALALQVYFW